MEQQTADFRALPKIEPGEPFAAQVDLGLHANEVVSAWLREQVHLTATADEQ